MSHNPWKDDGGVDMVLFQRNVRKIDPEMLRPYLGKHVAWSADASRIVAVGDSDEDVIEKLKQLGVPVNTVVFDFLQGMSQL